MMTQAWSVLLLELFVTLLILRALSIAIFYITNSSIRRRFLEMCGAFAGCISNPNSSHAHIEDLPPECLLMIMEKLPYADLLRCQKVCARWSDVVKTERLWSHADFTQIDMKTLRYREFGTAAALVSYKKYKRFLENVKIGITKVTFDVAHSRRLHCLEQECFVNLTNFLGLGVCKDLNCFEFKWASHWQDMDQNEFTHAHILSLSMLTLIKHFHPTIAHLKLQYNWTSYSVPYLFAFKHVQQLEIESCPPVHDIQRWHLCRLLDELTNLKLLKLHSTRLPHESTGQKYVFKSPCLETLDLSNCVNFTIVEIYMPKLKHFFGREVNMYYPNLCLIQLLKQGCPSLMQINKHRNRRSGVERFEVTENQFRRMRVCGCVDHFMRRPDSHKSSSLPVTWRQKRSWYIHIKRLYNRYRVFYALRTGVKWTPLLMPLGNTLLIGCLTHFNILCVNKGLKCW